jgi:hypothetical protein
MTLKELGEKIGGSDYTAVSMGLKRFGMRAEKDRTLKMCLAKIEDDM